MKYFRPYARQRFSCCILTDFAVTLRLFISVYASLRTSLYVLYDSLTFFTCNLSSNVQITIYKCKPYVRSSCTASFFLFTPVKLASVSTQKVHEPLPFLLKSI